MNLARHSISSTSPIQILDARFDPDCRVFTSATPAGLAVYQTWPLKLLRKRELPGGTLSAVMPLHTSSILFLVGGGRSPLYPPNKVVLWDDIQGKEVAELEFREKVRGLACRRGWFAVALRRRVVVFKLDESVSRFGEWDTCDNPRGLLAMATGAYSTLLAIPGRKIGHVQLVHLPECVPPEPLGPPTGAPPQPPPAPTKHPVSMIVAHETALSTLSVPPSGKLIATTSARGTLVRVWDTVTGGRLRELRRGSDQAEIYGVAFRPDEQELCVWSDKGTVHVFSLVSGSRASNRHSKFSPLTPFLPQPFKIFGSEWSYATYSIPSQQSHIALSSTSIRSQSKGIAEEDKCVVGWIQAAADENDPTHLEYQLVALTYTGGWYRLKLPGDSGSQGSSPGDSLPGSPRSGGGPLPVSPPSFKGGIAIKGNQPRHRTSSVSSMRTDKGKEREKGDGEAKPSRKCTLEEYRKFGRWDGW